MLRTVNSVCARRAREREGRLDFLSNTQTFCGHLAISCGVPCGTTPKNSLASAVQMALAANATSAVLPNATLANATLWAGSAPPWDAAVPGSLALWVAPWPLLGLAVVLFCAFLAYLKIACESETVGSREKRADRCADSMMTASSLVLASSPLARRISRS